MQTRDEDDCALVGAQAQPTWSPIQQLQQLLDPETPALTPPASSPDGSDRAPEQRAILDVPAVDVAVVKRYLQFCKQLGRLQQAGF